MIDPAWVTLVQSGPVAMPKSVILAWPCRSMRMFCGLTSRWTMPAWCAAASPSATCPTMRPASATGSGPLRDHLLERAALDVLEHQVVVGLGGAAIDERDHVGMGELGERPAFAVEPGPRARILVERGLEPLDGHVALQPACPRPGTRCTCRRGPGPGPAGIGSSGAAQSRFPFGRCVSHTACLWKPALLDMEPARHYHRPMDQAIGGGGE